MNSVLAPCPFCGGDADLHHVTHWWVSCSECEVNTCYETKEGEAIAAWNRRTPAEPVLPSEASTPSSGREQAGMREALGDAAMERLIAALASCIVGCQGRTNRDRARAVLAVIEAQGWRVERGKPLSDQVSKFLHGEL